MTTMTTLAIFVAAALAPRALALGYMDGPAKELVSTEVLGMRIVAWSMLSGAIELDECTGMFNDEALPTESIPFDLHFSRFYRIKEYSDGSTTMDVLDTVAGVAVAVGIFDYVGKTMEELWAELPVATTFEQSYVNGSTNGGSNYLPTVMIEVIKDAPVLKHTFPEEPGRVYYVSRATEEHMIDPYIDLEYRGGRGVELYYLSNVEEIYKEEETGDWHHYLQRAEVVTATSPDYKTDPSTMTRFGSYSSDIYAWYKATMMNGTKYGGLGNPPFIKINASIEQTYL